MSKGMYTIYALRHNPTGKIYVGATGHDIEHRVREHIVALRKHRHSVALMQEDFDKYGDDYSYFTLYRTSHNLEAFKIEKMHMDLLHTRHPEYGYNYNDITHDFSLCYLTEHHVPLEYPSKKKKHKGKG